MSDAALGRRVLREHRRLVVPLAIALAVNVAAYVFVVQPLSDRVANIAQRDAAAEQSLAAARREHEAAIRTSTSKDRNAQELARFYKDVLPVLQNRLTVSYRLHRQTMCRLLQAKQ